MARAHPDRLVIGLDPAWQRMIDSAQRAQRRPERGGAPNALFVCASIEDPPEELLGVADEVYVNLPWGRLLAGLVLGEPDICAGLRAVIGTDIWRPPVPKDIRDLPELTARHADDVLAPRLADHGWKLTEFRELPPDELPSSWARRLSTGLVALHAEAI
jgi:16S rRNA (adenine(1408)-N(1))-methyltransferase